MTQYPIIKADKEEWNKKINACLMYTISSEDEALPVLAQLEEILQRLLTLSLQQTLNEELVPYFFIEVFPVVCQKIIKSRYFKNQNVLRKSNSILESTACLLPVYSNWLDKIPHFIDVLQAVFPEQFYFKTNNQLDHKDYPFFYFPKTQNQFEKTLVKGNKVDIMKFAADKQKFFWSHGEVVEVNPNNIYVSYDLDYEYATRKVDRNSPIIAPYLSQCKTFQWRKTLKVGDLIDALDGFGGWYNATVASVQQQEDGRRKVEITFKVYNQNGSKNDEKGNFFGFSDYKQRFDAFSAQIAPYCSIAKEYCYESSKSQFDIIDDQNDMEMTNFQGKLIYALPRKKSLSQTIFKAVNRFGQLGGFDFPLKKIIQKGDISMLSSYLKGLGGVSSYLHKELVINQIKIIKQLLSKDILTESNSYTKEKSQMLFTGLRSLLKRIYTIEVAYEYENNLKIKLVEQNFQHDSLKKKLQGLNQLKEIIKSLTYGSSRNKKIIEWIKINRIFEKIYLVNSHVQLIKKSESFFRYVINENLLEVEDLEKLLKMAQKGDYETRISLYSLFKEVSHIFKKNHVNFLIDKILESQPNLILNEDIDLLHELSKFSNYFPTQKVMEFFEKLTLGNEIPQEINSYAIIKYSDIVSKNYEMKSYRKQILKQLFLKLKTHDITKVGKILKNIFEGIAFGDWGKKDLAEMLQQQNFDQIIISCIKQSKDKKNKILIIKQCMDLLLCIYKLCSSFKIHIETIKEIYDSIMSDSEMLRNFFKWASEVFKCEQGIQVGDISEICSLFEELLQKQNQKEHQVVTIQEFQILKAIFVEINKRKRFISVFNIIKDKELQKEYKRKVSMKELVFYSQFFNLIYNQNALVSEKCIEFFKTLYCSGETSEDEIQEFLRQSVEILKKQVISPNSTRVKQNLRIISLIIDDSQKDTGFKVQSLISKKKNYSIKLKFINTVNYISDTVKRLELNVLANSTLYELRLLLAKQLDIPWKAIKIENKNQIQSLFNCRTLRELGLTGFETLTVSRKPLPSQRQSEIIIDGQLNPKAIGAFTSIFNQHSTQEKMSKAQCLEFTVKCLGSASSPKFYEDKINNLFKEYDQNQDDFLELADFLKFYKSSALSRPSIVWSNLKSFGVQGNFKFVNQPNQEVHSERLPRNVLSKIPEFYELLFELLKRNEIATSAFNLLQRLPVSKTMEEIILSTESTQFDFEKILNTEDLYVFFYKLNIIEYLVFSNDLKTQDERDWVFRFLSNKGFEKILEKLFYFIHLYQQKSSNQTILLQILDILIDLCTNFLTKCYLNRGVYDCINLLSLDVDINDKIQFLVTGSFPKKQTQLKEAPAEIIQQYENNIYQKQKILSVLMDLLEEIWRPNQEISFATQPFQKQSNEYFKQILLSKLMHFLPVLQINEDFTNFISRMNRLIDYSKHSKFIKKFYELVLCLAFYTEEGKGQKVIISQMFKHLTMRNIISEHFAILAVLVSKYGVDTVNQEEIVSILSDNVFKSNNELTIEGCSKLLLNFNLSNMNQQQFDKIWEDCLFGQQKKAQKNSTRQALFKLILKATQNKTQMTNYILTQIKKKISNCIEHMRIVSCNQDNQRSSTGFAGLKNLGNICYINSMMQQFYMNKKFRYLIFRIADHQPQNLVQYKQKHYDDNILHQIQRIFAYLELTTRADYVPAGFCLAYKPFGESVNVMIQQDVQQFVSMFFDQLENKIKQTPFKTVIDTLYGGKATNLFYCHDCHQTKKVEENYFSITLEVKNSKSLGDSFNRYVSGQLISDFRCDFCGKKVDVSKKTRISKFPKVLIIHLQRIFFNLDTFINQKITTKHQFPSDLDMYPYSLAQYQKPKQMTEQQQKQIKDSLQYQLSGIICHIGNAESGHYISYIKISENKWVEFNDSIITSFNPTNIETQCFGGVTSNFVDDFEWDKSSQTTKSAYILLYEKCGSTKIQTILKSLDEKQQFLKQYSLSEVLSKIQQPAVQLSEQKPTQKFDSGSDSDESPQQQSSKKIQKQFLNIDEQVIMRKKSKEIDLKLQIQGQISEMQLITQPKEVTIDIDPEISSFIRQDLKQEILRDNQIHFFEKNLASPAFVKFFAQLLKQDHDSHEDTIKVLKNLTFGFWIKSSNFKDLLKTCLHFIKKNIKYADDIVFQNPQIISLLIEYSDNEVRSGIAEFLASFCAEIIQTQNLTLTGENQLDTKLIKFLDSLFSLLPTTVSKSWTKFGQYFQFWYQFALKGPVQLNYMVRKQILKHFLDYYLDKKSPLKIYQNKPQIGSKYANPNFSMLLKTVTFMISSILNSHDLKLSKDDYTILIHFECLEKLISENSQNLMNNLIREICRQNLFASEKIAIIILKGLHKSTFNNVQPYLDALHSFLLINDQHQQLRIKWVLGKPIINVHTITRQIQALNGYSFDDRVYYYHSAIYLQQASSLLDPIYELHKRAENFAMMSLKQALKLCSQSEYIFNYIWKLPPPTLCYNSMHQFYGQFIERYLEDAKRSYSYSQTGFNKQQLVNQVKSMYEKLTIIWKQKQSGLKKLTEKSQNQIKQSQKQVQLKNQNDIKLTYFPIKFNFIEKQKSQIQHLEITRHESQVTYALLQPTGRTNDSFISGGIQKNIDRLKQSVFQTAKTQILSGFYVQNKTKNLLRIKTDQGTQLVKSNDYNWVWAKEIQAVWECQKNSDWPKWSLYTMTEPKIQVEIFMD